MALLFMDSFDHYALGDITEKWTSLTQIAGSGDTSQIVATGRHGSSAWRMSIPASSTSKTLSRAPSGIGDTTFIAGFAFNPVLPNFAALNVSTNVVATSASQAPILLMVRNGGADQCWLRVNTDGTLNLYRGTTLLGTTSAPLVLAAYTYIEVRLTLHTSAGACAIRFNGTQVLNLTGLNTANSATNGWTEFRFGYVGTVAGVTLDWQYDDLYLLDGTGVAPWNDFLGDCRVDPCYPTGAGASAAWTPSAGANYAAVDETAPNDDTDYVSTATLNATDTHIVQDAPVVGATLYGVQHCLNLKKMDAGTCTVAPVVRHSGVDQVGAAISPSTSYAYGLAINQTNPGTGAQWTEAGFNAAEFGYKRTA